MNTGKYKIFLWWFPFPLFLGMATIGWIYRSSFEIQLAASGFAFTFIQLWLVHVGKKEKSLQDKKLKITGFLALLPASGLAICGINTVANPYAGLPQNATYVIIAFCGILVLCYVSQLLTLKKSHLLSDRFLRLITVAAISVPASLLVTSLLYITHSEGMAMLSSMTTIVFAAVSVLIGLSLILASLLEYRSTIDSIREVKSLIKSRKLMFTRVSIIKDAIMFVGKAVLSIVSLSFFMFVNTLYSAGMGIARLIALKMHSQDKEKQVKSYRLVGIIIASASICYVLYSIRLFYGGKSSDYSMNIALVIALYTFVEFGINIREAIRLKGSHMLEAKALRAISFASTLLCFVLTQTAIMSFASEGDNSASNALSGIVFGGLAALTGLFVIFDSFRHKKRHT